MNNLTERLGARLLRPNKPEGISSSDDYERLTGFRIPLELSSLIQMIGGPIIFEEGANFIPTESSDREDNNGYQSFEVLYGFTTGLYGLAKRYEMTEDDLPHGVIPIGDAPGGDQICLEVASRRVLMWLHDVEPEDSITEISPDIADFLDCLKPDSETGPPGPGPTVDDIIGSEYDF